ncbi:MAG: hypothetical protein RIG62_15170 [Cyclobacteriaceae bacterium]
MVNDNVVSVKLTQKEMDETVQKLKEIQAQLKNRLIALQPEERQSVPKMSDKTMPFVEKVVSYADSRPEFAPFYLSVDELKTDFKAVNDLRLILREAEQLCQALSDTILLSGSEAYSASLAYYNSVKQAAKANVPNAGPVYEDLRKRFSKK